MASISNLTTPAWVESQSQSAGLARHIGRVGALAVALGIGAAVIVGPAAALADSGTADTAETKSDDTGSRADDDHDPGAARGDANEDAEDDGDDDRDDDGEDDDADDEGDEVEDVEEPDSGPVDIGEDDADQQDGDGTELIDSGTGEAELDPDDLDENTEQNVDPSTVAQPAPAQGSANKPAAEQISFFAGPAEPEDTVNEAVPRSAEDAQVNEPLIFNPEDADLFVFAAGRDSVLRAAAPDVGSQALAPAPLAPIEALVAIPARLVTTVVGVLLSPFLAPAGVPANPPVLWAVLAWVRREVQRTFFNRSPILGAPSDVDQNGAVVTGTITGTDADLDPVRYSVAPTTAQGGTVTIDQQGNFVYTAPQDWDGATPLSDTFTVSVTDAESGLHFHGLTGLLFGTGHSTTRDVTVSLAPQQTGVTDSRSVSTLEGSTRNVIAVGADGTVAAASRFGSGTAADPYRVTVQVRRPGSSEPISSSADGELVTVGPMAVLDNGTVVYTTVDRSGATPVTTTTVMRPGQPTEAVVGEGNPFGGLEFNRVAAVQSTLLTRADGTSQTRVTVARLDQPLQTSVYEGTFTQFVRPFPSRDGAVAFALDVPADGATPATNRLVVNRPGGTTTLDFDALTIPVVGDDGTVAAVDYTGAGTGADPYVTHVNILRPGEAATRNPVDGVPGSVFVGVDGTVAYVATDPAGGPGTTVTVFRPDGSSVESSSPGALSGYTLVGSDGTVVYSTSGPGTTTTTVLRPGQTAVSSTAAGGSRQTSRVGANGTVLLTDVSGGGPTPLSTQYTILRPGAAPEVIDVAGPPAGTGLGDDGTVTYAIRGSDSTTYVVRRPSGAVETAEVPGGPQVDGTVAADGTVIHTTRVSSTLAYFAIMRPGEPAVVVDTPGLVSNGPVLGPDGTVYQRTDDRTLGRTNLTIVTASGEITRLDFAGDDFALFLDPAGGKAVLGMQERDASGALTVTSYDILVVSGAATV